MLGNKEKGSFGSSTTTTLVSRDTEVVGDIKFCGSLDIEGVVRGNIIAQSGKDAVVRIVEKGRVEGEIRAPEVIINGQIIGDVYSTKHLELASKAQVQGNVHYKLVEMAIGASVNGSLKHTAEPAKEGKMGRKHAAQQAPESSGGNPQPAAAEGVAAAGMQQQAASLKT
jgi:cytoskeletal protein CcmA (bactofilin family)